MLLSELLESSKCFQLLSIVWRSGVVSTGSANWQIKLLCTGVVTRVQAETSGGTSGLTDWAEAELNFVQFQRARSTEDTTRFMPCKLLVLAPRPPELRKVPMHLPPILSIELDPTYSVSTHEQHIWPVTSSSCHDWHVRYFQLSEKDKHRLQWKEEVPVKKRSDSLANTGQMTDWLSFTKTLPHYLNIIML